MKDYFHELLTGLVRLFIPHEYYYREERVRHSEQREQLQRDYWQYRR